MYLSLPGLVRGGDRPGESPVVLDSDSGQAAPPGRPGSRGKHVLAELRGARGVRPVPPASGPLPGELLRAASPRRNLRASGNGAAGKPPPPVRVQS